MILAIDPGNEQSAFVVFDEKTEKILDFGKFDNEALYLQVRLLSETTDVCCIEMLSAYGQVGKTVLDTCVWCGIFAEAYGRHKVEFLFRKSIVTALTGSPRSNDSAIRTLMITRFGNGNTRSKQTGNILEGLTADMWQALAIAVYKSDLLMKRVWHGNSNFVKG
jgi:hypothetical protein